MLKHGGVAQLGEHLPCKQGVDSSILFVSTSVEGLDTESVLNKMVVLVLCSGLGAKLRMKYQKFRYEGLR